MSYPREHSSDKEIREAVREFQRLYRLFWSVKRPERVRGQLERATRKLNDLRVPDDRP